MSARASGLDLDIQVASGHDGIPEDDRFRQWVEAALSGRVRGAELAIRVVDEDEGRTLNATYRGRDYATNVLSFSAELPETVDVPLLGDLVICAPVVAAEALEQDKALEAHWAQMVVHGVLHLLGHDHEDDDEAGVMESAEQAILARLGYADPYGAD